MDAEVLKKICAKEAVKFIENDSIIGLGGGKTISYLIEYLSEMKKEGFKVKAVTPSFKTKLLCVQFGIEVLPTGAVSNVSAAFDGCDEVDGKLNALKSGGGIHTKEKLIASMSEQYILLVDESKYSDKLKFEHPVVLEILQDSLSYVERRVKELGGEPVPRANSIKDGFIISDDGNILMDVWFRNVEDVNKLEESLKNIFGVIGTSLFVNMVTKAFISGDNGLKIISK